MSTGRGKSLLCRGSSSTWGCHLAEPGTGSLWIQHHEPGECSGRGEVGGVRLVQKCLGAQGTPRCEWWVDVESSIPQAQSLTGSEVELLEGLCAETGSERGEPRYPNKGHWAGGWMPEFLGTLLPLL